MEKTLALLHTSMVFIKEETMMDGIFAELMPRVRLINIIDDSLLFDIMAAGKITPAVTRRMCAYIQCAEAAGADAVLSLCSSPGPALDVARQLVKIPVIKIDDAMAEEAARTAERIGVLATVPPALGPALELIRAKGKILGKQIFIEPLLVEGAFDRLISGNKEGHDDAVSAAARDAATKYDLLVLAQASLTRLAPRLENESGKKVLTSPRPGIEYAKKILDSL